MKFDFRAGEGGCGLLVNFTAKPERIEVPPSARVEYGGLTERDGEVTFNLAGGRFEDLRIEVPLQCRSSSNIVGESTYELVQLFTASTIPVTNDTFRFRAAGEPDYLTIHGRVVGNRVEGHVLAGRVLTNGTSDFISCDATRELSFSATPGRHERRSDRDRDGVPDSRDRCDTVSDAGNPRNPRDGCPRGSSSAGTPTPQELLAACRTGGRAARAAQQDDRCAAQKVQDSLVAYATVLTDHAVETFNVGFVEITVPALASDENRGVFVVFARDIYALYRLPLRNLVMEFIVKTTPPDQTTVYTALNGSPPTFAPPNCAAFEPPELAAECKKAFRDLKQAVCDAADELYAMKYDLTKKRLLAGLDWTVDRVRFTPPAQATRCNIRPIP